MSDAAGKKKREKPAPVTAPIERFPVENGELVVGGVPLSRLARRIGATPFFAYDRDLITNVCPAYHLVVCKLEARMGGRMADRCQRFDGSVERLGRVWLSR